MSSLYDPSQPPPAACPPGIESSPVPDIFSTAVLSVPDPLRHLLQPLQAPDPALSGQLLQGVTFTTYSKQPSVSFSPRTPPDGTSSEEFAFADRLGPPSPLPHEVAICWDKFSVSRRIQSDDDPNLAFPERLRLLDGEGASPSKFSSEENQAAYPIDPVLGR
jgi:hypothetical protein